MNPNFVSIRNLLTLRYDPEEKPISRKAMPNDFQSKFDDSKGYLTENLLRESLYKIIPQRESKVVVALSSGVDSVLSLAILRKMLPDKKIIAICCVFENDMSEARMAEGIASRLDTEFKIIYVDSVFSEIGNGIFITKKPRWNTYQHFIVREAKKHANILITGDGGDEVFGGYDFRYAKFLRLSLPTDNWITKTTNYLECHNRDWVPDQKELFGSNIRFNWNQIHSYFKSYFTSSLEPIQQVMLADFNGKLLFDILPTLKAISSYYDIQVSSMFLDPDLVNFGRHLQLEDKYDPSRGSKIVLRKIAGRLGLNHNEEKKGFSPDLISEWKRIGRTICESYILKKDSYIFDKKIINHDWILKAFDKVKNEEDIRYLNRLISILAIEIWYRIFITNELNPTRKLI